MYLRDVLIHFARTEMNLNTKVLILLLARNPMVESML